jgi:small subunit ribosomal protein S3
MGQKINPTGFRVGISKPWMSRWYSTKKEYADLINEDHKIRIFLASKLEMAGLASIDIARSLNEITITLRVSKPGIVIGKGGAGVENLEKELKKITSSKVKLNAEEIKSPEIEAPLVAQFISRQLKRRLPYKRVVNSAINSAMDRGAEGIKIKVAGRLNGARIARKETMKRGSVPAQTLRANIDYAQLDCHTNAGAIGIKVWIHKGEIEL